MSDVCRQFVDFVTSTDYLAEINSRACFLRFRRHVIPLCIERVHCFADTSSLTLTILYYTRSSSYECGEIGNFINRNSSGAIFGIGGSGMTCKSVSVFDEQPSSDDKDKTYVVYVQTLFSYKDLIKHGVMCAFGSFFVDNDEEPFERWELLEIPE